MPQSAATVAERPTNEHDELKDVKVQIRISQRIKLHRIRLLTDQTLSETVREALDRYFSDIDEERTGADPE